MKTKGNRYECWYCGQEEACTADHFYPKSAGGLLKVYACRVCQNTKGDMFPLEFSAYMNTHAAIDQEIKTRIRITIEATILNHPMDDSRYYILRPRDYRHGVRR